MRKLLFLLLCTVCVTITQAQDTEPVYLKTYLQELETQIQNHLDTQEGNRKITALEGTNYLYQALDMFANQCKDGPFSKFEKLKKQETEAYIELEQIVNKYISGNLKDEDVRTTLQAWFNKHSFKQQPPLPHLFSTAIYPYNNSYKANWILTGDFSQLEGDSAAFISVMGIRVFPNSHTDSTLKFIIPVADFKMPQPVTELTILDAQLNLLYTTGKGKKPEDHKHIFYHYALGLLPAGPGSIRLEKTSSSETEEVQHKRTRTFLLNGIKGDLVEKLCVPTHTGWTVVPTSIELVIESSTGTKNRDWNYKKTGSGAGTCYLVEVFMNSDGPSGKLEYHLKYDIAQTTESNGLNVTDEALSWNEEKNLDYDPNWKATYLRPDGIEVPLSSGVYQWPGIEIEVGTENLRITTQGLIEP